MESDKHESKSVPGIGLQREITRVPDDGQQTPPWPWEPRDKALMVSNCPATLPSKREGTAESWKTPDAKRVGHPWPWECTACYLRNGLGKKKRNRHNVWVTITYENNNNSTCIFGIKTLGHNRKHGAILSSFLDVIVLIRFCRGIRYWIASDVSK